MALQDHFETKAAQVAGLKQALKDVDFAEEHALGMLEGERRTGVLHGLDFARNLITTSLREAEQMAEML